MGLLGDNWDDPRTMATLQMAAGLLGGGNFGQAAGRGLSGYQQTMAAAQEQEQRKKELAMREAQAAQMAQMHGLQLQQLQAQFKDQQLAKSREEAFRGSIPSPLGSANTAAANTSGAPLGTLAAAAAQPRVDPQQQLLFEAMRQGQIKPMEYISATAKDDAPVKLGEGEQLFSGKASGYKPLASGAKKEDDFMRNLRAAGVPEGSPQWNQILLAKAQKDSSHAPATNVSVSMDKGFGEAFANDAAKSLGASRDIARSAASTIGTLDRIDNVLKTGKVATGPTQPFQLFGMQMGQLLGIGGKDAAETLGNTRQMIQSASALAADGAKALAGQGQISDGERRLILRAAGGDIDTMTPPEISALTGALRTVNISRIEKHQSQLKNVDPKFAPFVPFYSVPMPQSGDPPKTTPGQTPAIPTRRWNPATGGFETIGG